MDIFKTVKFVRTVMWLTTFVLRIIQLFNSIRSVLLKKRVLTDFNKMLVNEIIYRFHT